MRRPLDLSVTPYPYPVDEPPIAIEPPAHHVEPPSDSRTRSEIMGYVECSIFGYEQSPEDPTVEIRYTVDPCPGTHAEVYFPEKWYYPDVDGKTAFVRDLSQVRTDHLVNEAVILDVTDVDSLDLEKKYFEKYDKIVQPGDTVLVRTDHSNRYVESPERPTADLYGSSGGLAKDTADWLVKEKGVVGVGLDTRSFEAPSGKMNFPVHEVMHLNKCLIIEDLARLDKVGSDRVLVLIGLPLKGRYVTGGYARIIAVEEMSNGLKLTDLSHRLHEFPDTNLTPDYLPQRTEPLDQKAYFQRWFQLHPYLVGQRGSNRAGQFGVNDTSGAHYISFTSHLGTHMSVGMAPNGYRDLNSVPLEKLVGYGSLIDIRSIGARQCITRETIKHAAGSVQRGDIVVLRTGHMDRYFGQEAFIDLSPYLAEDAVQWLIDREIKALVTDLASIEQQSPLKGVPPTGNNYRLFSQNRIPITEGAISTWLIRKSRFLVASLPFNLLGLRSAPTQVFVVEEWD